MYYNTVNQAGEALIKRTHRAGSQYETIKAFFIAHPNRYFSPSDILKHVYGNTNTPITSVRRSMTDLTEDNILTKSEYKKPGPYKDPEHLWIFINN